MRLLRFALPAAALASLILLTASDAPAGCAAGSLGMTLLPSGNLIANGRIVFKGTGNTAPTVAALADTALVLASDTEEIPLRIEAIHVAR